MVQTEGFRRDQLLYFEKINVKGRSTSLDSGDSRKLEIILATSKDDEIEEEDGKAKAK